MERVSELILRNMHRLGGGDLLLINPPRDSCYRTLVQNGGKVQVFTQDFGDYNWLKDSGSDAKFGVVPCPSQEIMDFILVQPKERARLHLLLHALTPAMSPAARLWLAGENRSGIKSSTRHLEAHFGRVIKADSARHCTLVEATQARTAKPFHLRDYEIAWSITTQGGTTDIISLPGIFAHGRLDPGTRLLLDCLGDLSVTGRVLDFACGSGVIGLTLLKKNPAIDLTLLDNSALALESTRRSLQANHLKATVLASDGLAQLSGRFDWIISNPPFHTGVSNDLNIVRDFCQQAGNFLTQAGKILMVCNHHLPYPAWLKLKFAQVDTLKSNREFKVILAGGLRR